MKAEELMIGDWVYCTYPSINKCLRVAEIKTVADNELKVVLFDDIRLVFPSKYIDAIPLTPEILEKNGFTYCKSNGGFYLYTTISYGNWDAEVVLFDVNSEYRNNQLHIGSPDDSDTFLHLMECNYVHQLQHAFRVLGIKQEIKI